MILEDIPHIDEDHARDPRVAGCQDVAAFVEAEPLDLVAETSIRPATLKKAQYQAICLLQEVFLEVWMHDYHAL